VDTERIDTEKPAGPARVRRWLLVWAAVVAAGALAGTWVGHRRALRENEAARALADTVARRILEAREAVASGQPDRAVRALEAARDLLERAEGGTARPVYAAVLVELAAVHVSLGRDPADALAWLRTAWQVPGLSRRLRTRIARDAGAASVLAGDLGAARTWYRRALVASPEDPEVKARLEALDLTGGRGDPP